MRRGNLLLWLDIRRLAVMILFLALFAAALREALDTDMWWHLATGRYILEHRTIPRQDVFSYTVPDHRWFTHEWLTQVAMYSLYRIGGTPALVLLAATTVTVTFALVYEQCAGTYSLRGGTPGGSQPYTAIFTVLLGAFASAITWGPRPQILNPLLLALFITLLGHYRRQTPPIGEGDGRVHRALLALPPLTALWANLHSGFYLGLVLLSVILVGDGLALLLRRPSSCTLSPTRLRNLLLILLLCVLAALLNPNGYHMLLYPFGTLGSQAMQAYIQEWASPNFHRPEYWFFALLLLGGAAALGLVAAPAEAREHQSATSSRRAIDLTDLFLFLGFGFAGLVSARHIPLFGVVAVPIVSRALGWMRFPGSRRPGLPLLNWVILLALIVPTGIRVSNVLEKDLQVESTRYPAAALEYVRSHGLADQRMYNSYNWGGYLIWKGFPVFIDGRADVYGDAFIDEYMLAYWLHGDWRVPLDRYSVEYVLVESNLAFARLLEEAADWKCVYRDEVAVIFVRAG